MAKRITPQTEQEIIKLYQLGLSMAKAGKPYCVTAPTVMRILDRYKIPKRTKGGIYKLPDKEIIARYKNGESCQKIADFFNVSFHTISNVLEKIILQEITSIKIPA
jgi:hypothetical protein